MLVFSPKPYGQSAIWPTYVTAGNRDETRNIATEQAWEQRGLVTTPVFGISEDYLPPYYGSLRHSEMFGLGDGTQVANASISAGATVASASAAPIAASLGLAVPVVGAAIAGIALAIGAWVNRVGPKQKVATTKIVNDAEPLLKQNLAAFQASEQTIENQQAALQNFNQIWAKVVEACSSPVYGNPGKNCISDRQRGGKWDWFSYYYDPIVNAKVVSSGQLLANQTTGTLGAALSPILGGNWELLLGGGLLLIGIVGLFDGKKGRG